MSQLTTEQLANWASHRKPWNSQIAVATPQHANWACRQKIQE